MAQRRAFSLCGFAGVYPTIASLRACSKADDALAVGPGVAAAPPGRGNICLGMQLTDL